MQELGQTKSVGFQFGLRKTFAVASEKIWAFLFSAAGLKIWLGELTTEFELNKEFTTKEGIKGYVRVLQPNSHIRLNWQKPNWENLSTLQVRVVKNKAKTTLSFHQEKLLDANQREEVKEYWQAVLQKLTAEVQKEIND